MKYKHVKPSLPFRSQWLTVGMVVLFLAALCSSCKTNRTPVRVVEKFTTDWGFMLVDSGRADAPSLQDTNWRLLDLPHDWSIELPFDSTSPTGNGGGALRGGLAWYKKVFKLPAADSGKKIYIDFDGIYERSEVLLNGQLLGFRPNGYISFRYDMTPHLHYGEHENVLLVKVDNSHQPNSRWYSGSGIYRNVWLTKTSAAHVAHWGTQITTPEVNEQLAKINISTMLEGSGNNLKLTTEIVDASGAVVATANTDPVSTSNEAIQQSFDLKAPHLWNIDDPYLYKAITTVWQDGKKIDDYETPFGIRYYAFDVDKGFSLNGTPTKIVGVCLHHDLGCLGTALHYRGLQRQLEIMKAMGLNGIRTSHNPPAPELLELCDKMGFIVQVEAFDMWAKTKSPFDYGNYFDKWHKRDLEDLVKRDRNHPSVFMWSLGNEIAEQFNAAKDTSGRRIVSTLNQIVKTLDNRPTVTANNNTGTSNHLLVANATDLIGYNYNNIDWAADSVHKKWGNKPFIITESVSALQSRGHYDQPSDSIRIWPTSWDKPLSDSTRQMFCSAYENCITPWGSSHTKAIQQLLANPHISGMFVWTGQDYIGEPTPYIWPARSSYFGIVDLAGFPKDVYYLYQSVFTDDDVLHLFPHWNWTPGESIDMVAYYNHADEVELYINGKSQGKKSKKGNELQVMWRVTYEPGEVKIVSRMHGKAVKSVTHKTAGAPHALVLEADRRNIKADGEDLSFIKVKVVDKDGNIVPIANNAITFTITGEGKIAGLDNGYQADLSSFKGNKKNAFNGLALAVVQSQRKAGTITLTASSPGLQDAEIEVVAQ